MPSNLYIPPLTNTYTSPLNIKYDADVTVADSIVITLCTPSFVTTAYIPVSPMMYFFSLSYVDKSSSWNIISKIFPQFTSATFRHPLRLTGFPPLSEIILSPVGVLKRDTSVISQE